MSKYIFTESELKDIVNLIQDIKIKPILKEYMNTNENIYDNRDFVKWQSILNKLEKYKTELKLYEIKVRKKEAEDNEKLLHNSRD